MAIRCSAEQLAEAVTIWSIDRDFSLLLFHEREDIDELKPLDLLLSTVNVFLRGFDEKFEAECDEYKRQILFSKQHFIDYLKPRCLLLAERNGCFDLVLTCAFFSHEICDISFHNQCFHLSRVACKLLTKVLEDKFSEMFNTDSRWEELMSYCTKINAAVFPSKENRPPHYDTEVELPRYFRDPNIKYRTFCKESESEEQFREDGLIKKEGLDSSGSDSDEKEFLGKTVSNEMVAKKLIDSPDIVDASDDERSDEDSGQCNNEITRGRINHESTEDSQNCLKDVVLEQEGLEFTNEEHDAKFIEKSISNEMAGEKLIDSPVITESSDDESLDDDSVYWDYDSLRRGILRTRITVSMEHLKDVLNLLAMIKRKIDPESIPSNKYDIPISDNEDIEELEKCMTRPNFSEWEISLLEGDVESIKREICEKKNEKLDNLSQTRVRPEDITDGELFQNVIGTFDTSDDEDHCELCDGKMRSFKTKWIESFGKKYSIYVSDFLFNCGKCPISIQIEKL